MNPGIGLFDTVTNDPLRFGIGSSFEPKRVTEALGLNKQDVSRLASVSVKSVRYGDAMPEEMRERLEEIAQTVNLVAQMFDGDAEKAVAWFKARNPMLGDVSPREMIRLGRYERLRKFIVNALLDRTSERPTVASAG